MIVTTTNTVQGRKIIEYKGIVFGEVITGIKFYKNFAAELTNFFGGRLFSNEGELVEARKKALIELARQADLLGANAVVGVSLDYKF